MKRLLIYNLFFIAILAPSVGMAKMYKWVDEKGQKHFGDKIPVRYLAKEHDVLNAQGIKIEHKAAASTKVEKEKEQQELELQLKAELELKKQQKRDRVLMDTYTTTRGLIKTRDARLEAVDSQIQLSIDIIDDASAQIISLTTKKKQLEKDNKVMPQYITGGIKKNKYQIKIQKRILSDNRNKRQNIDEKFKVYIARFKILNSERIARRKKEKVEREALLRELELSSSKTKKKAKDKP